MINVKDDGKGFDTAIIDNDDFTKIGLRNMKERANRIHSTLLIESSQQNGTEVILRIPTNSFQISAEESREIEDFNS